MSVVLSSINRTIIELKQNKRVCINTKTDSINRTIIELKRQSPIRDGQRDSEY